MLFIRSAIAASVIAVAPGVSFALNDREHTAGHSSGPLSALEVLRTGATKSLAAVQSQPDFSLPPAFGSVSLRAGFTPDPYSVEIIVGGEISASRAMSGYNIGRGGDGRCRGNIAEAPDFRVQYQAGSSLPLIFRAVAGFDSTLVVNGPDGVWYCDDDSGEGRQAELQWDNPQSGQYDIWVGAYSSTNNYETAVLEISELLSGGGSFGGGGSASGLNFSMPPLNGVISLSAGFTPDPRTVNVSARTNVSVPSNLSSRTSAGDGRCRGHTGTAPDVSVQYQAGSVFPLVVRALADYDTTLVVNDPNGGWHCDDDSGQSVQAQLVFERPASGRYDIWFGAYSSSQTGRPGRIEISELD